MSPLVALPLVIALALPPATPIPALGRGAFDCSGRFIRRVSGNGAIAPQSGPAPFRVLVDDDDAVYTPGDDVTGEILYVAMVTMY